MEDLQGLTLPVTKITKSRISSQPLKEFTRPSQGSIVEHRTLPSKQTKEGFDPNAYKLMVELGTQEDNSVVGTQGSIFTRLSHSTPSQVSTRGLVLTRLNHSIPSQLLKDLKAKQKQNERTNFLLEVLMTHLLLIKI